MRMVAYALLLCGAAASSSILGLLKLNADDVVFTTSPSFRLSLASTSILVA